MFEDNNDNMFRHTGMAKGQGQHAQRQKTKLAPSPMMRESADTGPMANRTAANSPAGWNQQPIDLSQFGKGANTGLNLGAVFGGMNPQQQAPAISQASPVAQTVLGQNNPWTKGQIFGGYRPGQGDFNRLGGGFGQADTDSIKHTFGRIAQNFQHTPDGLNQLIQDEEFKRLFPNAKLDKDWIDFGGQYDPHSGTNVGKVDVMHAWDPTNNSGKNWQWLTEEEALKSPFPASNIYTGAMQQFQPQQQQPTGLQQLLQQLLAQSQPSNGEFF